MANKIPGGLAENKSKSDFNVKDLEKGQKVEMEHTEDSQVALEIAMDHLTEDPKYYDKLNTLEKQGSRMLYARVVEATMVSDQTYNPFFGWLGNRDKLVPILFKELRNAASKASPRTPHYIKAAVVGFVFAMLQERTMGMASLLTKLESLFGRLAFDPDMETGREILYKYERWFKGPLPLRSLQMSAIALELLNRTPGLAALANKVSELLSNSGKLNDYMLKVELEDELAANEE